MFAAMEASAFAYDMDDRHRHHQYRPGLLAARSARLSPAWANLSSLASPSPRMLPPGPRRSGTRIIMREWAKQGPGHTRPLFAPGARGRGGQGPAHGPHAPTGPPLPPGRGWPRQRAALAPTPRLPLLRRKLCNSGAGCGPDFLAGATLCSQRGISVTCPPYTIKNGGFLRFLR
jgi:hypothetical protein